MLCVMLCVWGGGGVADIGCRRIFMMLLFTIGSIIMHVVFNFMTSYFELLLCLTLCCLSTTR